MPPVPPRFLRLCSVALSVDMVGHAHTDATVECIFVENRTASSVVDINFLWIGIALGIVIGIELVTVFTALFEFLCAQSPFTMKGLTSGLSFASAVGLTSALTGATFTTWAHAWSQPATYPTCAFWFYLFIILVTVVGLGLFCIVAKWYKKRKRDELLHEQKIVEDYRSVPQIRPLSRISLPCIFSAKSCRGILSRT